jgi:hypothetical protein
MSCARCGRVLAGVAVIVPGKPAICGRADCLAWARDLVLPPEQTRPGLRLLPSRETAPRRVSSPASSRQEGIRRGRRLSTR